MDKTQVYQCRDTSLVGPKLILMNTVDSTGLEPIRPAPKTGMLPLHHKSGAEKAMYKDTTFSVSCYVN